MREQKGITLVALVITIIVLLILAGVSIATLGGQNGILTNADKAKLASLEADAKEKIDIATTSIKTEIEAQIASNPTYKATDESNTTALQAKAITGVDAGLTSDASSTKDYKWTLNGTVLTLTYTTKAYVDLSKKVNGATDANTKVVGSIDLSSKDITSATATK